MRKFLIILLLPLVLLSQDSWISIEFSFDQYADEVSWSLYNETDTFEVETGYYENQQPNAYELIELNSGNYNFELLDAWGDGLSWPQDGWCLVSNECQDTLFYASGNYGLGLIESLTIAPCAPPDPPVIDCMDEDADNYNPDADVNDLALCEYPPCEGWGEPFVDQTCVGGQTLLYYNWESSSNPSCNVIQIIYGGEDTNVYNFDVNIDNGIWGVYVGNGQMPPNWEEEYSFQVMYADSTLSDTIFHTPYPCTQGCTDPDADNYNPWAIVNDGTCGNQACDIGYTPITIEITLDNWPGETGWSFVSGDGSMEISSGTYTYQDVGQTYVYNVCAMEGGFEFIISDTYGDGMAGSTTGGNLDGDITIKGCDGEIITQLSNGDWVNASQEEVGVGFGSVAYSTWQQSTICSGPDIVEGCMDFNYQEFNPLANIDNGSCITEHILGCVDPVAFNYDSLATQMEIYPNCDYTLTIEDDAGDGWGNSFLGVVQGDNMWSFTMGPGEYEQSFPIWLETDKLVTFYYFAIGGGQTPPEEVAFQTLHNSFTLTNANGVVLLEEGNNPFADNGQGALQPFEAPLFTTYKGLPFCGTLCIPTIEGCMDINALNYNSEANTDNGSCIDIVEGCTNELAFNYNEEANYDDGSCEAVVVGCMDEIAWNYNENANTDGGDCIYLGCTDDAACNYDYIANADSGGCIYPDDYYDCSDTCLNDVDADGVCDELEIEGCVTIASINYNPDATNDDGSCVAIAYGCTDLTAFNYDEAANTDNGSCEPIVFGCIDSSALNYDANANTDNGSCIAIVEGCTDSAALNYNENANVEDGSCIDIVYGCTDDTALNYNELANTDNGSCITIIEGCTDSSAINYNELANVDDFSCIDYIYGCTDSEALNYNELANTDNGSCIEIVEGCTNPIALNYNADANVDDFSCILPIYGCTNPEAFNYNELANVDNDSCIDIVFGCTNSDALNYNSLANTDDGSCIIPIYGCMDEAMFNYNPLANVDNGSCIPFIYGCNDESAYNYDPLANTSDNSCCYIGGCMDSEALNYNELACYDDGGCIEIIEGCMDNTAYNYNPLVNVSNPEDCLYDAGCYGGPGNPYWLNDDCYAWVIDVDSYCCDTNWDNSCQDLYNYCEFGWPISISELDALGVIVFPNPTTGIIEISTRLNTSIKMVDMKGNIIIDGKNISQIDLSNKSAGLYNLIVEINNKQYIKKIAKQ